MTSQAVIMNRETKPLSEKKAPGHTETYAIGFLDELHVSWPEPSGAICSSNAETDLEYYRSTARMKRGAQRR